MVSTFTSLSAMFSMCRIYTLFILIFEFSIPASSLCFNGVCANHYPPANCISAPTAPIGKAHRRDRILSLQEEAKVSKADISSINARGNPICYYPTGVISHVLKCDVRSNIFYIPAGIYTLDWISSFSLPDSDGESCTGQSSVLAAIF